MIIRVNYNNGKIKLPKKLIPIITGTRDEENRIIKLFFSTKIDSDDFYDGYIFDLYINGKYYSKFDCFNSNSELIETACVTIHDNDLYQTYEFEIMLDGYYYSTNFNYKYNVTKLTKTVKCDVIYCSEETFPSDDIFVSNVTEGKLIGNKFYKEDGVTEITVTSDMYLADLLTNKLYKLDTTSSTIKLI